MDRRGWLLMWTLAFVWGASYLLIKLGLDGGMDPAFLVCLRLVLAAAVLLPIAHHRGALEPLRGKGPQMVALAAMQVAVPFLLLTYGESHIASGLTGILVATAPIFTAILVALGVGVEARATVWSGIGVAVGMVGVGLLFGVDLTGSSDELLGGLMVVGTGFGYAIGAIYLRRHFLEVQPVGVAAGSMAVSAVLTLPFALTQLPTGGLEAKAILAVTVLGIFGTGFAFLIFYTLIATVGAARASLVAYLA